VSQGAAKRRIVITIDSGDLDTDELHRLARLAHRLDAELEAVFVEDSDVLRLGGLKFLEEFRPTSMRSERVHSGRMEQELRAMARRAERTLSQQASQQGVPWTFRIWRGSIERELLSQMEADVLALMRLGTVMLQRGPRRRGRETVTAVFDGSEETARALNTAAELATESDDIELQVLLVPTDDAKPEEVRRQAKKILTDYTGRTAYHAMSITSMAELMDALRESESSALVMPRDNRLLRNASLRDYLTRIECPLLLVR